MITVAERRHIKEIKFLWREAFGDDSGYINLFLEQRVERENILAAVEGAEVCGMLFILPCRLRLVEASFRCAYFYAIAAKKEKRGQGIGTALLDAAYTVCRNRGYDVCMLAPASASLFAYYAGRGYQTQGYAGVLTADGRELEENDGLAVLSPILYQEVFAMREYFLKRDYLEWDLKAMKSILEENAYLGGHFYRYDLRGEEGCIACLPAGDSLMIKEYVGKEASFLGVLQSLHKRYRKHSYLCRISCKMEVGVRTPLAMTRWIAKGSDRPFYAAHLLD